MTKTSLKSIFPGRREPRDADIIAALDKAGGAEPRRARARAIVMGIQEKTVRNFDIATKLALLESLAADAPQGVMAPAIDPMQGRALARLYRNLPQRPRWRELERNAERRLIRALQRHEGVRAARDSWESWSPEARIALLAEVARVHSSIFGMAPATRVLGEDLASGQGRVREGKLSAGGEIRVNVAPAAGFGDFNRMLRTILELNTYFHQRQIVDQLNRGMILPNDSDYLQTRIFRENLRPLGRLHQAADGKAYDRQPVVNHARRLADKVVKSVVNPRFAKDNYPGAKRRLNGPQP